MSKTKKSVYEVVLSCTTTQRKQIVANSPEEAREIAERDDIEWNEKEEVEESEISVLPGDASEGRYIEFINDDGDLDFKHFDPSEHENAEHGEQ